MKKSIQESSNSRNVLIVFSIALVIIVVLLGVIIFSTMFNDEKEEVNNSENKGLAGMTGNSIFTDIWDFVTGQGETDSPVAGSSTSSGSASDEPGSDIHASALRTYYIDFVLGSDSNTGLTKTAAWKHAPGMAGCISNCASHSVTAGDAFIFRGGVVWDHTNFRMNIATSGNANNHIYYGVDKTWFSGTSWARPVFDGEYYDLGGSPTMVYLAANYIDIEGIEMRNAYLSQNGVQLAGILELVNVFNITIKDCYIHSWRPNPSVTTDGGAGGISGNYWSDLQPPTSVVIDSCEISNKEWPMVGIGIRMVGTVKNSILHDMPTAILFAHEVYNNTIYNINYPVDDVDPNYHENLIYMYPFYNSGPAKIYNNLVYNVSPGACFYAEACYNGAVQNGVIYVYNNVMYNSASCGGAYVMADPEQGSGACGEVYVYGNTFQIPDSSNIAAVRAVINHPSGMTNNIKKLEVKNNLFIGNSYISSGETVTNFIQESNTMITNAAATANGYNVQNKFKPTMSNAPTVGTGQVLSSLNLPGFNSDILGVSRGSVWDRGAYEYDSGTPITYYNITLSKIGNGNGNLSINDGPVCNSATCSAMVAAGNVKIEAYPNSTSNFISWNNTCAANNPCTFTINGNTSIRANFTLIPLSAPIITTQPQNATSNVGGSATFSVAANANPASSYQWQTNSSGTWTNITGATLSSYTINNLQINQNNTYYRAFVYNLGGSVLSSNAKLNVNAASRIPTAGMIAYYNFDNNVSNQVSSLNHGNIYGNPSYISGKLNQAMNFDGDDYVSFGDLDSNPISISLWFNANQLSGGWSSIFMKENTYGFELFGPTLYFRVGNGAGWNAAASDTISTGQWYNVVATYDGTNIKYYRNGVQIGGAVAGVLTNSDQILRAGSWNGVSEYFNGAIDEVRIYNRVLSAAEVDSIYNYKGEVVVVNGQCGQANARTYSLSDIFPGSYTLCAVGTANPLNPILASTSGATTSWTCNADTSVSCSASRENAIPPAQCGQANARTYSLSDIFPGSYTLCAVGTANPLNPILASTSGATTSWTCTSGSSVVNCGASRIIINNYVLSVSLSSPFGTVTGTGLTCSSNSCSGTYVSGTRVVLTANPNAGFNVDWSGCDSVNGNQCTVTMNSQKSLSVSFNTIIIEAPAGPSGLALSINSGTNVVMNWVDNSNNEEGFIILRRKGTIGSFSQVANVSANTLTYTDTGLNAGTWYYYKVYAYNKGGNSAESLTIGIKTCSWWKKILGWRC